MNVNEDLITDRSNAVQPNKPHICKLIDRRVVLPFSTTNKQAEGKMSTQVLVID